ncbi:HelD family protein [Azotosporobacter soli]|uniref:HelD family protein n=1 Tax=Azotosporobacter soli TaxID=3055040 RepID=UPI0031FEFAF9
MNEQEQRQEIERLAITMQQLECQLAISEDLCSEKHSETRDTLLDYWGLCGGNIADEAQLVETANRQRALSTIVHELPRNLRKMLDAPYFGRIDFAESEGVVLGTPEAIYVGLASLSDGESGEFLVYDWRAPVAGMFYDFGLGKAGYECPGGRIDGMISLKRQYKIKQGRMQFMFDADLKIDDEVLQEILGKSVDDKMHTIVNSIQREQNQIIRDGKYRALFVEGPAGSGKTSVALHRIAFLLYRDRASINEKNVLILSPNHVFSDYISNVLPEMGEKNVLQMTFQDYAAEVMAEQPIRFETRTAHLEVVLSPVGGDAQAVRAANIRFKSSAAWEKILQAYLGWLEKDLVDDYPDIMLRDKVVFSKEKWRSYYKDMFAAMPPHVRLDKIRRLVHDALRPLIYEIRTEQEKKILATTNEVNKKTIKAMARMAAQNELRPVFERIDKLTRLTPLAAYRKLFKGNWLAAKFSRVAAFPSEWTAIQRQTLAFLNNGILTNEDLAPFLYFQGMWQGFPVRRDVKHLIIDEAQDYTTLQFKILSRMFPECTWTVVGDTAQAIHPFLRTASFAEMSEIVALPDAHTFQLSRSYRSTREIQAFCQALLRQTMPTDSVNRSGVLPALTKLSSPQALAPTLLAAIEEIRQAGWNSIGIIGKNIETCRRIFLALKGKLNVNLAVEEDGGFYRGIVIIPSYLAKGLEFDAVLVVDADASHYRREEERNLLYTICTRTLHELRLFYRNQPSPFLAGLDETLYRRLPGA